MSLLNGTQMELGNAFVGKNYKGEMVERRLVGGAYGSVVKYFLIDEDGNLKSHKQDTIEAVTEGFEIVAITAKVVNGDMVCRPELNDGEGLDLEVGDIFIALVDGVPQYRQMVGGVAYGESIYFTINPETGKRTSRTRESIEEVQEGYLNEDGTNRIIAVLL